MSQVDLTAIYNQIKSSENARWMPELQQESISQSCEKVSIHDLHSKINDFAPTIGWLQTIDAIHCFPINSLEDLSVNDFVETGELLNAQNQTVHIRPAGSGHVFWSTINSGVDGETMLYTEATHQIKFKKQTGSATYRLYWEKDNIVQSQAQLSRLVSIEFKENK